MSEQISQIRSYIRSHVHARIAGAIFPMKTIIKNFNNVIRQSRGLNTTFKATIEAMQRRLLLLDSFNELDAIDEGDNPRDYNILKYNTTAEKFELKPIYDISENTRRKLLIDSLINSVVGEDRILTLTTYTASYTLPNSPIGNFSSGYTHNSAEGYIEPDSITDFKITHEITNNQNEVGINISNTSGLQIVLLVNDYNDVVTYDDGSGLNIEYIFSDTTLSDPVVWTTLSLEKITETKEGYDIAYGHVDVAVASTRLFIRISWKTAGVVPGFYIYGFGVRLEQ